MPSIRRASSRHDEYDSGSDIDLSDVVESIENPSDYVTSTGTHRERRNQSARGSRNNSKEDRSRSQTRTDEDLDLITAMAKKWIIDPRPGLNEEETSRGGSRRHRGDGSRRHREGRNSRFSAAGESVVSNPNGRGRKRARSESKPSSPIHETKDRNLRIADERLWSKINNQIPPVGYDIPRPKKKQIRSFKNFKELKRAGMGRQKDKCQKSEQ
ncbi:hypothetical protein ACMFMG_001113 [Clarireedia jacksonii]